MIVTPDFADHWKTRMLVELLSDEAAPMYVLRLWAHCQNRKTHVFQNLTVQALKALCRFAGPAEELEAALLASGYIRHEDGALVVHQWDEYNSSLVAAWDNGKRGGRPKVQAESKITKRKPTGNPAVTQRKPTGNPAVTQAKPNGNPAITQAKPTANPAITQAKPIEKRRWDGEDGEDGEDTDSSEPEEPPVESSEPEEPASEPAQEPILVFECVGYEKAWAISEEKLREWQEVFPDIDVLASLRRARQWCIDNPAKRKTAGGMARFINNWLGKAQDNGESRKGRGDGRKAHGERPHIPRLPTSDELYGPPTRPSRARETNILCKK